MYAAVLACNALILASPAVKIPGTTIAFGVALSGSIYAVYLTWLEVVVIGAICQWCVVSAILTLALTVIEGRLLWSAFAVPISVLRETDSERAAS